MPRIALAIEVAPEVEKQWRVELLIMPRAQALMFQIPMSSLKMKK
jgi:hypothetical protein